MYPFCEIFIHGPPTHEEHQYRTSIALEIVQTIYQAFYDIRKNRKVRVDPIIFL